MADSEKLVIVLTRGADDERSSVAFSIANAGLAAEMEVTLFLASSGVDWARKGAADSARLNPLDPPIAEMLGNLLSGGGTVLVCPPCSNVRGYDEDDLIDGVTVAGGPALLEAARGGATTFSF